MGVKTQQTKDRILGYHVRLAVDVEPEFIGDKDKGSTIYVPKETREIKDIAVGRSRIIGIGPAAFSDPDIWGKDSEKPKIGDLVNHRKYAGLVYKYKSGHLEREINDVDIFSVVDETNDDEVIDVF